MKAFVVVDNLSDGGSLWINSLPPMLSALAECVDLTVLEIPRSGPRLRPKPLARLDRWRAVAERRRHWAREIRAGLDPDGPNVLMVWGDALFWWRALEPVWDLFSHRVLYVLDTVEPDHVSADALSRFDLVACFCEDLGRSYAGVTDRPGLFLPAHMDTLRYHQAGAARPVDLLVSGRREDRYHRPLFLHFNRSGGDRVFLDFATRGQTPMTREQEFGLLLSMYGRAAAAFCYEPSAVPRFLGRSPLLERWVHAWASGCTVFGTPPHGAGTAALQAWPESTIALPEHPADAIALVEGALSDGEGMARRRLRNVREAVARHDTRYRVAALLDALGLPRTDGLARGLQRLADLGGRLAAVEA